MKGVALSLLLAVIFPGMVAQADTYLTLDDVKQIIAHAATRAREVDPGSIIAIVDREGYVLGVWDVAGDANPNAEYLAGAISRAGTAAFLSSNQNAFTSRTAGYIIQPHFPPFVRDAAPGPLVGVGISSVYLTPDLPAVTSKNGKGAVTTEPAVTCGHSDVNFIKQIPVEMAGTFDPNSALFAAINPFSPTASFPALPGAQSPGTFGVGVFTDAAQTNVLGLSGPFLTLGAIGTSLNDSSGGVPLYKDGKLVGGIGVTGAGSPINVSTGFAIIQGVLALSTINRAVAALGLPSQDPLGVSPLELPGLPGNQSNATPGFQEGPDADEDVALAGQTGYGPDNSILATNDYLGGIQLPYVETTTSLNGVQPLESLGTAVAQYPLQQSPPRFLYPPAEFGGVSGELRFPIRDDPTPGLIGRTKRLNAGDVTDIINKAAARSGITRAAIRLPVGTAAQVFISVVGNPGKTGVPPPILGVFRTGDATIFSWDVAVQKARTAFFFSNDRLAESSRTVGFLAQRYYPPGLDGNQPGPYFGVQEALLIDALLGGLRAGKANPYLRNQITIFPGGFPLYRNGVLVGAIGVSGDGVDQDDIIAASGCASFLAPHGITADNFLYRGARLPYAKFPRDPGL